MNSFDSSILEFSLLLLINIGSHGPLIVVKLLYLMWSFVFGIAMRKRGEIEDTKAKDPIVQNKLVIAEAITTLNEHTCLCIYYNLK